MMKESLTLAVGWNTWFGDAKGSPSSSQAGDLDIDENAGDWNGQQPPDKTNDAPSEGIKIPGYEDKLLAVTTENEPVVQKKTYTVSGNVTMNGMPLANVIVQLSADLMATTTDEDGKFVFYDVEPAQHSLTAIKSDKVIGYLSFELKKDSKTDISLNENGTYTVLIGQNSAGIELHLELNEENGVIAPV